MTPEELSVLDAAAQGQKAGEYGHGASMNPYQSETPENTVWENNRAMTISVRLNSLAKLAREVC